MFDALNKAIKRARIIKRSMNVIIEFRMTGR